MRVDRAVSAEVIRRLQPLGVQAALDALEEQRVASGDKARQVDLALEQARYEAARAHRQYDAVDPANRLVAADLEQRWNDRLSAVRALEEERSALAAAPQLQLSEAERERLLALGADVELAWNSPSATAPTRKRIIRTLIDEVVVKVEDNTFELTVRWQGGDHTPLSVTKSRAGQHRWTADGDVVELVTALARQMPDYAIAAVLNRAGKKTGRGNSWTRSRVCGLRNSRDIPHYVEGERAKPGRFGSESA
jgi:hypothetical protein